MYNLTLFTSNVSLLLKYYLNNGFARFFLAGGLRFSLSHAQESYSGKSETFFWQSLPIRAWVQLNHQVEMMYGFTPVIGVIPFVGYLLNINTSQVGISYILLGRGKNKMK